MAHFPANRCHTSCQQRHWFWSLHVLFLKLVSKCYGISSWVSGLCFFVLLTSSTEGCSFAPSEGMSAGSMQPRSPKLKNILALVLSLTIASAAHLFMFPRVAHASCCSSCGYCKWYCTTIQEGCPAGQVCLRFVCNIRAVEDPGGGLVSCNHSTFDFCTFGDCTGNVNTDECGYASFCNGGNSCPDSH